MSKMSKENLIAVANQMLGHKVAPNVKTPKPFMVMEEFVAKINMQMDLVDIGDIQEMGVRKSKKGIEIKIGSTVVMKSGAYYILHNGYEITLKDYMDKYGVVNEPLIERISEYGEAVVRYQHDGVGIDSWNEVYLIVKE